MEFPFLQTTKVKLNTANTPNTTKNLGKEKAKTLLKAMFLVECSNRVDNISTLYNFTLM